jgi:hypothetical protein
LRFPESAVVADPGGGGLHGLGIEAAAVDAAVDLAAQEASGFKDAEMFGNGGKGHVERLGKGFDGRFALREAGQNGTAGGIRERGEGGVEGMRRGGIVNHTVYYYAAGWRCQGLFSNGAGHWSSQGGAPRLLRAIGHGWTSGVFVR